MYHFTTAHVLHHTVNPFYQSKRLNLHTSCSLKSTPVRKATQARGVDIEHVEKLESFFTDQGFTNVVCRHVSCPIGWNGLEGDMLLKNIPRVMEAMRPFIMPVMGVGQEEWAEIMNRLQQQYGVYRTYNIVPVGYGFKPLQN
ncbi:hypothetical protein BC936DRAFT_149142 [Jimgerdemannia flammicorona]|uniref:Uncharacterized protein n=2 Tax=Jimgerdemannia flammicorona TaxID=994334 RepID=A0A433QTM9_9FUNG|nr:hypothetical protein BC936DRAFT_149142 [Jimgerdemannia flammicorona]RUS33152.1 hypothetical protein BC938DRAFT_472871 [Jimgerdemannia flammicorona]